MTLRHHIPLMSATRRGGRMALALATVAVGSMATAQDALHPAAQCAAFWYGYSDYAKVSAYLDTDPSDAQAAEAFRKVALRLAERDAEVDSYIAAQRPLMTRLMESYIYGGDTQSRDIFERLSAICEDFAERHPETRDLK